MEMSFGMIVSGGNLWVLPGLFNGNDRKLRSGVISKERGHCQAFCGVDIVL
jgi:hypothetical protein